VSAVRRRASRVTTGCFSWRRRRSFSVSACRGAERKGCGADAHQEMLNDNENRDIKTSLRYLDMETMNLRVGFPSDCYKKSLNACMIYRTSFKVINASTQPPPSSATSHSSSHPRYRLSDDDSTNIMDGLRPGWQCKEWRAGGQVSSRRDLILQTTLSWHTRSTSMPCCFH
jgi:hypothetical protein